MAPLRAQYLIDKSALARMPFHAVRRRLAPILESGRAASCAIVDLEVLYSARNHDEHEAMRQRRARAYHEIPVTMAVFQRAIEVQGEFARTGGHRIPIPNLLIAAIAESAQLTVLHYDRDYDLISEMTGQAVEWVVPQGSVGGAPGSGRRRDLPGL